MFSTISPKKNKQIVYNYDKLSPERESARDDEEKGVKKQKEERSFQMSNYGERNHKKNDEKYRSKSKSFTDKVKIYLSSLNFKTNRYHFVELYIFFNLYLKDNYMTQEGFINANMMVFTPLTKSRLIEKHENHKKIINKIFKLYDIDNKKQIHIDYIIDYLRVLSLQTEILTVESMFNILDKENKGFISQEDITMFIEGINDFLNSNYYNPEFLEKQEKLDKILKKYFTKNREIMRENFERFYEKELLELRDLITEAEELIMRKQLDISVEKKQVRNIEITNNIIQNEDNSISSHYSIKDSLILNESKLEENKDTILKTKSRKSNENQNPIDMKLTKVYQGSPYKNDNKLFEEKTENTRTVSHKNSQKEFIETQKEKEKKFVEKISNLSPIKQNDKKIVFENKTSHNRMQFSTNTLNEIIFEDLLDYDKQSLIDCIKLSTSNSTIMIDLYDFKCEELINDLINLSAMKKVMNRKEFVNIFTNIIISNSFDFYIFKIKRGINELFNLLIEENQNDISCNEAIGSILMLTKGNEEEKISAIFQMVNVNLDNNQSKKIRFSEILTGIFKLYLKKGDNYSYNIKLLAEELTNKFFLKFNYQCEMKSDILQEEFTKWVFKEENKNRVNLNRMNSNLQIKTNEVSKSVLLISSECSSLFDKLRSTDCLITNISTYLKSLEKSFYLNNINVLDAAEIFKKNSLLGILNKSQIFQCFSDIYKLIELKTNLSPNEDSLNRLFKLIDSKNEFYNMLEVYAGFSLLFSGTKEEKLMSIFDILQKEKSHGLKYKEVLSYFYIILKFSLNNSFKIEEVLQIAISMTNDIYLVNNLENTQKITYQALLDYIKDLL